MSELSLETQVPFLRYDFWGSQPAGSLEDPLWPDSVETFKKNVSQQDAFTALLDDLAKRPLEKPERYFWGISESKSLHRLRQFQELDCFDPRERFKTERCDTGVKQLAYEEGSGELHFQECNQQREFSFHLFYLEVWWTLRNEITVL